MTTGLKVSAISRRGEVLPESYSIDADYTGDDADWDGIPGEASQDQWKQPVRVATTASITISTALNAGDTLDGVTLAAGDRVLVKDQSTGSQNGIYVVAATPYRATDFDDDDEVLGALVYVIAGTTNAATVWTVTNTTAPAVGTDAITWAALAGGSGSGPDTSLNTVAASGSTETIDVSVARTHDITLTADCTLTLTGAVTAEAWFLTLMLRQDGTGGWDVTWPGSVEWPDTGTAPTLTATAGALDVVTLFTVDGGTTWYGSFVGLAGEPTADAHIADTADAHDASAISIVDTGGYYTGTDVEAALQEIGAGGIGGGSASYLVISDTPSTPLVFADILQNEAQDDLIYSD